MTCDSRAPHVSTLSVAVTLVVAAAVTAGSGRGGGASSPPPEEAASRYYQALLAGDTTAAERVSNGMLPVDFTVIDSVRLGAVETVEPCPDLPDLPDGLASRADSGRRRMLDSISSVFDSLFGAFRGADRCVDVETILVQVTPDDRANTTVEYLTHLRRTDGRWLVEAFTTGTRVPSAVLKTMGSQLRELSEVLQQAADTVP